MQMSRVFAFGAIVLCMVFESGCRSGNVPESASDHPGAGIPIELATERAASIRDVRYNLSFSVPEALTQPITGRVNVQFTLDDTGHPVVLDFEPGAPAITSVSIHNRP